MSQLFDRANVTLHDDTDHPVQFAYIDLKSVTVIFPGHSGSQPVPEMSQMDQQDGIILTSDAARRIGEIMESEFSGDESGKLRITVTGGGCSGFQYSFSIDAGEEEGDREFHMNDATVVVDDVSLRFLKGSVLRYIDNLEGSYFTLENPNARTSCGCGTSFSV